MSAERLRFRCSLSHKYVREYASWSQSDRR